jgi:phosphonate transport system permease protein
MTAVAGHTRPVAPPRSKTYILPLIVGIVGAGLTGFIGSMGSAMGPVWGLALAAVVFAIFWWRRISRSIIDALILGVTGTLGIGFFSSTLLGRSEVIDFRLALTASLGWAMFGVGVGAVVVRNRRGLRPGAAVVQGLVWGGGALLVLLTAGATQLVSVLSSRQLAAGELEELSPRLFVALAAVAAAFGLSAAIALWGRLPVLAGVTGAVVLTILAYHEIGFSTRELFLETTRIGDFVSEFWPPVWTWPKSLGQPPTFNLIQPFIETLQIAIIGATVGSVVALPLSFMASRATSYNNWVYGAAKGFMNVLRTVPDLIWAIFFATAVGYGSPFAGALAMMAFSLAIMAKLLSETVDAINPGPMEAGKASGGWHSQVIQYTAFPQVSPNYVAYAFYIFELNIRASVIIGFVGAGGIGRLLDERRNFFQWDQVMAIVLVIFVTVLLIEAASIYARRKLL